MGKQFNEWLSIFSIKKVSYIEKIKKKGGWFLPEFHDGSELDARRRKIGFKEFNMTWKNFKDNYVKYLLFEGYYQKDGTPDPEKDRIKWGLKSIFTSKNIVDIFKRLAYEKYLTEFDNALRITQIINKELDKKPISDNIKPIYESRTKYQQIIKKYHIQILEKVGIPNYETTNILLII